MLLHIKLPLLLLEVFHHGVKAPPANNSMVAAKETMNII